MQGRGCLGASNTPQRSGGCPAGRSEHTAPLQGIHPTNSASTMSQVPQSSHRQQLSPQESSHSKQQHTAGNTHIKTNTHMHTLYGHIHRHKSTHSYSHSHTHTHTHTHTSYIHTYIHPCIHTHAQREREDITSTQRTGNASNQARSPAPVHSCGPRCHRDPEQILFADTGDQGGRRQCSLSADPTPVIGVNGRYTEAVV